MSLSANFEKCLRVTQTIIDNFMLFSFHADFPEWAQARP